MAHDELQVDLWRGREDGELQRFTVPRRANQTILDVVSWIQRHLDPEVTYRYACRVGMCGSCAMNVNGRPRWTCRTHVASVLAPGATLRIEPLANLPVIKDLVTDMSMFFDKWQRAGGRFVAGDGAPDELARIPPESAQRRAANAAIECINCAVCYAACDLVAWDSDYLGPAALNRAWAAINDTRAGNRGEVLAAVAENGGCFSCHTQMSCAHHCPVALNPTASIAALKRAAVRGS